MYILSPWVVTRRSGNTVILRHGVRLISFSGPGATTVLAPLLDTLKNPTDLEAYSSRLSAPERSGTLSALEVLKRNRFLLQFAELESLQHSMQDLACLSLVETTGDVDSTMAFHEDLSRHEVTVVSDIDGISRFIEILEEYPFAKVRLFGFTDVSIATAIHQANADTTIVACPTDPYSPLLRKLNEQAYSEAQRWLPVLPFDGEHAVTGPLIVPSVTACFECYQMRRRSTLESPDTVRRFDHAPADTKQEAWVSPGLTYMQWGMTASLLAQECQRVNEGLYTLRGTVRTISWTDSEPHLSQHRLYRVPRCPVCGGGAHSMTRPWFDSESTTTEADA